MVVLVVVGRSWVSFHVVVIIAMHTTVKTGVAVVIVIVAVAVVVAVIVIHLT